MAATREIAEKPGTYLVCLHDVSDAGKVREAVKITPGASGTQAAPGKGTRYAVDHIEKAPRRSAAGPLSTHVSEARGARVQWNTISVTEKLVSLRPTWFFLASVRAGRTPAASSLLSRTSRSSGCRGSFLYLTRRSAVFTFPAAPAFRNLCRVPEPLFSCRRRRSTQRPLSAVRYSSDSSTTATTPFIPNSVLTLVSISAATDRFSWRNALAFSRPCPRRISP
jgi:hypothetical protein